MRMEVSVWRASAWRRTVVLSCLKRRVQVVLEGSMAGMAGRRGGGCVRWRVEISVGEVILRQEKSLGKCLIVQNVLVRAGKLQRLA